MKVFVYVCYTVLKQMDLAVPLQFSSKNHNFKLIISQSMSFVCFCLQVDHKAKSVPNSCIILNS